MLETDEKTRNQESVETNGVRWLRTTHTGSGNSAITKATMSSESFAQHEEEEGG